MTRDDRGHRLAGADLAALDAICDRFEAACRDGVPSLDGYLAEGAAAWRPALLVELAAIALAYLGRRDPQAVSWEAFVAAQGAVADELQAARGAIESAAAEASPADRSPRPAAPPAGLHVRCPHCCHPVELVADTPADDVTCGACGSTFCLVERGNASAPPPTLQRAGRFELTARVGVGGFGTVWKARDPELDRYVAVKIPRRGQLPAEEVELFFREARAAAQLRHPGIVPVFEIGRADDFVYIVSDFVHGVTLAAWMARERRTPREAAAMAAAIADALHHAHEQGVVHRDLKPSNVMVDERGQPQIMDFGLAKRETGEATMTLDGQILGTAAYMAPEQAAGQAHWTDRRADVYALGVIVFQMLTGELPFRGHLNAQLAQKLHDEPPHPRTLNPQIPVDLATICRKCLERQASSRYATAGDVAAELRRFLAGEPIRARPIGRAQQVGRWARRRPAAATALALAAALAIAGPLAALTIEGQRRRLLAKTTELDALAADEQQGRRALGAELAALQAELEAVRGAAGATYGAAASWRRALCDAILAAWRPGPSAAPPQASEAWAQDQLAWGMLLAAAERPAEAALCLEAARQGLEALAAAADAPPRFAAALADCCDQLVEVHGAAGDAAAARRLAAEALRLRAAAAPADASPAAAAIDRVAAHYAALPLDASPAGLAAALEAAPPLTQAVIDRWPRDADQRYEAACRLTARRPWLLARPGPAVAAAAPVADRPLPPATPPRAP